MEEIFTDWNVGKYIGLYMIWLEFYVNITVCFMAYQIYIPSALTIKEKNAFRKQNGVTVVQASK